MTTTYVILGSHSSDGDVTLLASGYRSRAAARSQMHNVYGPGLTRTVTTLRWWRHLRAGQAEVNEERDDKARREQLARKKSADYLRSLVCPAAAPFPDNVMVMLVGSTHGREQSVPVVDKGLRALLGAQKSIRVQYDGRLDYDSHLLDDGTVEWYEHGVRHRVLIDHA
jgi:hypothetical protein